MAPDDNDDDDPVHVRSGRVPRDPGARLCTPCRRSVPPSLRSRPTRRSASSTWSRSRRTNSGASTSSALDSVAGLGRARAERASAPRFAAVGSRHPPRRLALPPGSAGLVLVTEDRWAAPLDGAARAVGGRIVAGERISAHRFELALAHGPMPRACAEHEERRTCRRPNPAGRTARSAVAPTVDVP